MESGSPVREESFDFVAKEVVGGVRKCRGVIAAC